MKKSTHIYSLTTRLASAILIFVLWTSAVWGQASRFDVIAEQLKELSKESPGLNEKVELSVNGVSIQEFIRGMASTNEVNISVDPNLNTKIINNFTNVTVSDVLLFLAKRYDLDLTFIGSIISITAHSPAPVEAPKYVSKPVNIIYDKYSDELSMDLSNDSLALVVKAITKTTEKNVLISPDLMGKMVNGYIQRMPFNNALDKFAFSNDLRVTPSDNFYLVEKREVDNASKVTNKNDRTGRAATPAVAGLSIRSDDKSLLTVDAVNVPISDIVGAVSTELKKNYYVFSEPKGNSTVKVENASYEEFLRYLLNGTDYTFKRDGEIYLIGERNLEGLRATKVVQLKFRTVDKIMDIIPVDLRKGLEIKAFPDLNSLILSGSQPRIDELEAFMRDIDRVVPVVVIEVMIVDVRNSRTVSTGIEAGLGKAPAKTSGRAFPGLDLSLSSASVNDLISGINGFGFINLGKVTPNFYLTLKLLEEQGVLRLRSTPKLATLNGHEAKMSIGKTEYYLEVSNNVIGTQNPQNIITQQYKSVNADLSLSINPIVSGDEQITLDIGVKQSNFTERISPSAPPGTITRDFQSLIRVKNEEMVILGGLEENATNDSGSGVPILSRIPVLKWFFSSRNKSKSKSKLTIFIKPTVLY